MVLIHCKTKPAQTIGSHNHPREHWLFVFKVWLFVHFFSLKQVQVHPLLS